MALATVKGGRTTPQFASRFGVHASGVTVREKRLFVQVAEWFADERQQRADRGTNERDSTRK